MKAVTLLEALRDLFNSPPPDGISEGSLTFVGIRLKAIIDFYGAPFSPDLLTGEKAVFAGWGYREREVMQPSGKKITLWKFDSEHGEFYNPTGDSSSPFYRGNLPGGYAVSYPTTIADFISDCHRAGIPLELSPLGEKLWRGEA